MDDAWRSSSAAARRARHTRGRVARRAQEAHHEKLVFSDGSYPITGGTGYLGLPVARWIAEHGARCLVLTGRRALSGRSPQGEPNVAPDAGERIAAIEALEGLGARVHVVQADAGNRAEMSSLFAWMRA